MCDARGALKLCQTPLQSSLLYTRGSLSTLARAGSQLAASRIIHSYYEHTVVLGSAHMCTTRPDTKLLAWGTPE